MRKLASIQKITDIKPIMGADNIACAKVLGYQIVIAKKDNFSVGEKVIFIEPDSIVPNIPQFNFMEKNGFRVKTIRLRKQISQGLILPLSQFSFSQEQFAEGEDLTALLQINKLEDTKIHIGGDIANIFPAFVPKTDAARLQSAPELLELATKAPLSITGKMDGASSTFYWHKGRFAVCSRNVELKKSDKNLYWQIARKYDLENKLKGLNLAIQGEICGPKVQKNRQQLSRHKLFVFDIFNISSQEYLKFDKMKTVCERLELPTVPIVRENFVAPENFGIEEWLKMSRAKFENDTWLEGIVVKYRDDSSNPPVLKFKVISPDYLLKHNI